MQLQSNRSVAWIFDIRYISKGEEKAIEIMMRGSGAALEIAAPENQVTKSLKPNDFRRHCPTPIITSFNEDDDEAIPETPATPRHKVQGINQTFFPSPRSVLERRSSSGSCSSFFWGDGRLNWYNTTERIFFDALFNSSEARKVYIMSRDIKAVITNSRIWRYKAAS